MKHAIVFFDGNLFLSIFPEKLPYSLSGFRKALLQNPRDMIRGRIFSEMIRIQDRKSELQAESQSYGPKVGDAAGQTPKSEPNRPEQGPEWGLGASTETPP